MFVDVVKIKIKAGNGGNGSTHFLHDIHHITGGPDGGNGGKGGDVYFIGDPNQTNLVNFYYNSKFVATNGGNGSGNNCNGKKGDDLIIKVPCGTVIKQPKTGKIVADIISSDKPTKVLTGGRGGRGNAFFAHATRQIPNFSQLGEQVEEYEVLLELKVIADVGLVGMPNVGKSTLLSRISNATPKIANYHFTTLDPNLGVVKYYDQNFVVADLPGLIEGASKGAGLGHKFLRHIERTRMLVHVVDISGIEGGDPFKNFNIINNELKAYSEVLAKKPMIIALSKCDILPPDSTNIADFKSKLNGNYTIIELSAITNKGIDDLLKAINTELSKLPREIITENAEITLDERDTTSVNVYLDDDGVYVVEGGKINEMVRSIVLSDTQSFAYFQKRLKNDGIIDRLKELGAKEGDEVRIKDYVFTMVD